MNQLQALYRLQTLESSLDSAKKRVAEIEATLENDEVIARCRADVTTTEQHLHEAQAVVKDLELDIAGIVTKTQEGEELLYSGKIKNPKELKERQDEINSLKKRRESRESELMAAIEKFDFTRQQHQNATSTLQETEKSRAEVHETLKKEREHLNRQMSAWLTDRKSVIETIDPANYKTYKKIKSMKNGLAVSRLEDVTCSVCQVEQNQSIQYAVQQAKEIVRCHNCGRILVEV